MACKQRMNWQIEINPSVCSYKIWNIKMAYGLWLLYCLIDVSISTYVKILYAQSSVIQLLKNPRFYRQISFSRWAGTGRWLNSRPIAEERKQQFTRLIAAHRNVNFLLEASATTIFTHQLDVNYWERYGGNWLNF